MELTDLSPKALATRERLLDAAERCLSSGRELTSGAVAQEAGVSTGTFYRYFDDRDDLLSAAFGRQLDRMIDTVERALDPAKVLDEGLQAVIEGVVADLAARYAGSAPVIAAALVRIRAVPAVGAIYRSRHRRAVGVFATFLERVRRAGLARVEDVEGTAVAAVVLVQGLNHPALRDEPDPAVLAAIARALRGLLDVAAPTVAGARSADGRLG